MAQAASRQTPSFRHLMLVAGHGFTQAKAPHSVFNAHRVTAVAQENPLEPSLWKTEHIPMSGILPGAKLPCWRFTPNHGRSYRYADVKQVKYKPGAYPQIKRAFINKGSGGRYLYFHNATPREDMPLQCHEELDKQALQLHEYRLVLDKGIIQEKLKREAKTALAQQEAQNQEAKTKPQHFQKIATEFLATGQWPPVIELSKPKNLGSPTPSGVATLHGERAYQEDTAFHNTLSLSDSGDAELFGVLDGHTSDACAKDISYYIGEEIEDRYKQYNESMYPDTALWNAAKIGCVDASIESKNTGAGYNSGTTFCGVLIHNNKLTFINSGDSRGIVISSSGEVFQMTEDARPKDPRYQASIEKRQGEAVYDEDEMDYRVGGVYAPARGLGDGSIAGTTARPKLTERDIAPGQIVVLATDGLWDVTSSEEVGAFAYKLHQRGYTPYQIADAIAQVARSTYKRMKDKCGSQRLADNITVAVIFPTTSRSQATPDILSTTPKGD